MDDSAPRRRCQLNFSESAALKDAMDDDGGNGGREAAQLARVALIVSAIALAVAILGLFLPIG